MSFLILTGDVRNMLATLPDESVHCVVTSPPYWSLRDYGVEGQLGMEPTMGEHIETMVAVFREVRRVLRKDGTVWLNYGDCYASGGNGGHAASSVFHGHRQRPGDRTGHRKAPTDGLKPKDLCMIPNRLAIALQEPYHLGPIKNEIDRAWLAGLIDADGCIGIRRESNGKWNPGYIPYLTVGCSDRLLVERCAEITGLGKVNVKSRAGDTDPRGIKQRRDGYVWRLDGQIASRVIRDIYPFLVQKRPQAMVCNAVNISQKGGRPTRTKPVPPDVVAYRQRLYEAIKSLNQRQPVDLPEMPAVTPNIEQGWWVRSEIIWHKSNPMPESVTDRPATAHEKIWLLRKSARYFYDAEAVRRPLQTAEHENYPNRAKILGRGAQRGSAAYLGSAQRDNSGGFPPVGDGANLRNVWTIPTKGFSGAHYATFPPDLVVPCIKAGTSEKGCCAECGAPWVREIGQAQGGHIGKSWHDHSQDGITSNFKAAGSKGYQPGQPVGWSPSCACAAAIIPCTVLDPFIGSGTTAMVADRLGRDCIGIDLNPANVEMALERVSTDAGLFAEVAAQ